MCDCQGKKTEVALEYVDRCREAQVTSQLHQLVKNYARLDIDH